jgi:hypothetical protein
LFTFVDIRERILVDAEAPNQFVVRQVIVFIVVDQPRPNWALGFGDTLAFLLGCSAGFIRASPRR